MPPVFDENKYHACCCALREIDLLNESGDRLFPVEIKKTASPSQNARVRFDVLNKLGHHIGHGALLCLVECDIPLSAEIIALPVSYV